MATTAPPQSTDAVAGFYRAIANDDVDAALAALSPEVVLHVPGSHPLAGDHRGTDGLLGFVLGCREVASNGERTEVLDLLGGSDHVAALCRVTAERADGVELDNRTVHMLHTDADGLIDEIWFHNWDQPAVDKFWAT